MSESVVMLPQVRKIHCWCERDQISWVHSLNNANSGFTSHSIKPCGLLGYVYAGLWGYVLIVKVAFW